MVAGLWLWVGFHALLALLLSLEFFFFNSSTFGRGVALWRSMAWIAVAFLFDGFIWLYFGLQKSIEFLTVYLVEKSMSLDNLFVFTLIFSYFNISHLMKRKILFYGVVSAFLLRFIMIFFGLYIISIFHWIMYLLGSLLVVAAIRLVFQRSTLQQVTDSRLFQWLHAHCRIAHSSDHKSFFVVHNQVTYVTSSFLALLMIEGGDLLFALDSVPATLGFTQDLFVAYTGNVFALLGLRSLYFLVEHWVTLSPYVAKAIGCILGFVGLKMVLADCVPISTLTSLLTIGGVLCCAALVSVFSRRDPSVR